MPKKDFEKLIRSKTSVSSILKIFNLTPTGNGHKMIRQRCEEEDIDISHIPRGLGSNKGRNFSKRAIPLEEVMIKNSTYSRGHLKNRLLKQNILKNKCSICGQEGNWNGEELVMVLDHINGINNDHRLENLRMLCPNCNSQQKTFSGRNKNKKEYYCIRCNKIRNKHSKSLLCKKCYNISQRKAERPSKEKLLKEVEKTNYCFVGKKYNVSDKTIRKWLK
jgi:hypothetical protein